MFVICHLTPTSDSTEPAKYDNDTISTTDRQRRQEIVYSPIRDNYQSPYLIGTSVQSVTIRTGNHLNRLHDFDGPVNR